MLADQHQCQQHNRHALDCGAYSLRSLCVQTRRTALAGSLSAIPLVSCTAPHRHHTAGSDFAPQVLSLLIHCCCYCREQGFHHLLSRSLLLSPSCFCNGANVGRGCNPGSQGRVVQPRPGQAGHSSTPQRHCIYSTGDLALLLGMRASSCKPSRLFTDTTRKCTV